MIEQGKVLADVYRSGGKPALDDAIHDTMTYADPQTAVAVLGSDGHQIEGNLNCTSRNRWTRVLSRSCRRSRQSDGSALIRVGVDLPFLRRRTVSRAS